MPLLVVAVALVAAASAAALPGGSRHYFPLEPGREWSFENRQYGGEETLTVARTGAPGVYRLEGFPGARSLRVRWLGQTLQAWDTKEHRWEALLRLGAPAGTAYPVDLPQELWSNVRVRVASRRATVTAPGKTYSGAIRFALRPDPGLADAGLTGLWLAPGIGPVRWIEQSFAGPVEYVRAGN